VQRIARDARALEEKDDATASKGRSAHGAAFYLDEVESVEDRSNLPPRFAGHGLRRRGRRDLGRRDVSDGRSSSDAKGTRDHASSADSGSGGDGHDPDAAADGSDVADASDAMAGGDAASPLAVDLGAAGNFVVLAKSGISTVPTSAVTGDLGVSPAAASYITGFSLIADPTKVFSTSTQVTGTVYASNYTPPTPANLTTAIGDMQTAFTDAAGRPAGVTGLGRPETSAVQRSLRRLQMDHRASHPDGRDARGATRRRLWIFQIAKTLTVSDGTSVHLSGGAVAKNVFWQVAGSVDLGTTSHFEGVILGKTEIALKTGASINGRLFAQTAVSIEGSTVVEPAL